MYSCGTGSTTRISKWGGPMKWKKYRPPWLGDEENLSPKTSSVSKFNYIKKLMHNTRI